MNLRFLTLPKEDETLAAPFVLSLSGDHEVTIAPCRRVSLYERDCIKIETIGCTVKIVGDALTLAAFRQKEVSIKGLILSLHIERGI